MLALAVQVYQGLFDQEIDEVEAIVLDRFNSFVLHNNTEAPIKND